MRIADEQAGRHRPATWRRAEAPPHTLSSGRWSSLKAEAELQRLALVAEHTHHGVLITGTDWAGVAPALRPAEEVEAPAAVEVPATSEADPPGPSSTTVPPSPDGEAPAPGDVDDPDDPAFFRAAEPAPGADCALTP